MKINKQNDFFKKGVNQAAPAHPSPIDETARPNFAEPSAKARRSQAVSLAKKAVLLMEQSGMPALSKRVESILSMNARARFTVSVVGEFSRGKSSFLNKLLNNSAMLPTGDLPTTAVMTRIRYAQHPKMAVFDAKASPICTCDISPDVWRKLSVDNFAEKQLQGSVIVGVPNEWLGANGIEMIDSPGAGDLSSERTQQIAEMLDSTDGAIICISATSPFSLTEKEFVLQRIIKRKVPFTMLVINKLDLIAEDERSGIVKYIHDVLSLNKMDIPVYIPSEVKIPGDSYASIQGMDKIKEVIEGWVNDPVRQSLLDVQLRMLVGEVVEMALSSLNERLKLCEADEEKRRSIIQEKKDGLEDLDIAWQKMENEWMKRSTKCCESFRNQVEECKAQVVEQLQYTVSQQTSPSKWWNESYPHILKTNLSSIAAQLEGYVARTCAEDSRWFNSNLMQGYKTNLEAEYSAVADKSEYREQATPRNMEFDNLDRARNISHIGTAVVTVGSYLLTPLGPVGAIAVGALGTVIQRTFFKKKIDEERMTVKEAVAQDLSSIMDRATYKSEKRIQAVYDAILKQSAEKRKAWLETERSIIDQQNTASHNPQSELREHIDNFLKLKERLA